MTSAPPAGVDGVLERFLADVVADDYASVVGPDDRPLLTEDEWERFGGRHFTAALKLFNVARRLTGLDAEDVAKN